MMNYSVVTGICPHVEATPIERPHEACSEVLAGEVKYRQVIDMSTLN